MAFTNETTDILEHGFETLKMPHGKRIAIIGGGPCGLTAGKCCLEENLDVVIFEKSDSIGGLWLYRDSDAEGMPSVMKSTVINTSKEMSAFSDFPPPKHFPNFMHNTFMFQYFKMYAEKFGLLQHVRTLSEVINVVQTEDYERTGRWYVTIKNIQEGTTYKEAFDGVLVATGHHCYPHIPELPGLDKFKGQVLHTHSLKKATGFEDKNILVIGIGNSAVDAAVELSTVSKQLYLSTRRGTWLFQRVGPDGRPFDAEYTRRKLWMFNNIVPLRMMNWYIERELNKRVDHASYGLKPQHRVLSAHPTINDALPNKLLSGTVVLREDVKDFTENGVIFKDDDVVTEIDIVVLATGYQIKFPFFSEDIVSLKGNKVELYKHVYPPHLPHPSLAFIALVQNVGAIFPVAEIQARWYALLMNGKRTLPRTDVMLADIRRKNKENGKRYVASPRHTIQVDYIPYMDEIADQVGCSPNLLKILFTDPKLFWCCFSGPSLTYQYRLRGPHCWQGARASILSYKERVLAALKTRRNS